MKDLATIANGLSRIFDHGSDDVERSGEFHGSNKGKAEVYEIRRLCGVTCPHCDQVGMIASLGFKETKDVGIPRIPIPGANDNPVLLANHLERNFRNHYDRPAATDDEILLQEADRKRAETENTGWFCFGCRVSVDSAYVAKELLR